MLVEGADPIAGYLFIICIELLLLKLSRSKKIHPWTTTHSLQKLADAYADDINLFLKFTTPETQLKEILHILEQFRQLSGLKTNISKTKYTLFGNAVDSPNIENETKISVESKPFRLLGINLNVNLDALDVNWEKAIKALKTEIGLWWIMKLTTTARLTLPKPAAYQKSPILLQPSPSLKHNFKMK